jgi:hypothetical protein
VRLQQLTLDGIRHCAEVAEAVGVNMALENHSSVFLEAEDILWLRREVGSARLTTCPDPSNWSSAFLEGLADAKERELVFSGAQALAPHMTQSHLKVIGITPAQELMGFQRDGLDRLLSIYHHAGYQGGLAFEHVGTNDPVSELPQAKTIVESALRRLTPAGPASATNLGNLIHTAQGHRS